MQFLQAFPEKLIITDVEVWNVGSSPQKGDVLIEKGILKKVSKERLRDLKATVIRGTGKALIPLGVDPQVHLRTPGQPEKDLPECGLAAALSGGVGAVLAMPNTKPVIDTVEVCDLARQAVAQAELETGVKVLWTAAITKGQRGKEPVDFKALANWGVAAFTDDGVGVLSDELMKQAFRASAETGKPILQHAEMPGHGGVLASGAFQAKLGIPLYPPEAEAEMVERDLRLLEDFPGARYHVLHVSAAETLRLISDAKEKGLPVTCEVSPHHLLYTSDEIEEENTAFKMNPPLRSARDRAMLRLCLREGIVDFVATDHAPHDSKSKGSNFKTAAFGTTGLEAMLRVLLLLHQGNQLRADRLVQVFSRGAARFLGIQDEFGEIQPKRPLRAVLVDPAAPATEIKVEDLKSLSKNSCFLGARLPGKIHHVFNHKGIFGLTLS